MTTTYQPRRTTTDVVVNGEDWHPIRTWLEHCHRIDPEHRPPYLFIDPDSHAALEQLLTRTRRLHETDDLHLRLPHNTLDSLRALMRFWEGAPSDIRQRFRQDMPSSGHFQSFAFQIE